MMTVCRCLLGHTFTINSVFLSGLQIIIIISSELQIRRNEKSVVAFTLLSRKLALRII